MKRFAILVLCLLPWVSQGAERSRELLSEVSPEKAQALSDYNAAFLQEHLYFSKRHRIVKVDTELLLEADEFTITPFDDVTPLNIVAERSQTLEDTVHVKAHIVSPDQWVFGDLEIDNSAIIGMRAWDVYEATNEAVLSIHNRFSYSRHWRINESNQPVLVLPPEGASAVIGPPPSTPEEIERHKTIDTLQKRQFWSVRTVMTSPEGIKYVITPLRFTPRYSVIQEIDPSKLFSRIDAPPDGSDNRSHEERSKAEAYAEFKESLPEEIGKIVKGDIQ